MSNNKELDTEKLKGISALFVHAAKIDEHYTDRERKLISNFLKSFIKKPEIVEEILKEAEKLESDSNQLLNFTNIVKKNSLESKSIVIKELWKIIMSDSSIDEYESSLMRRICGLIYFPDKLCGEIRLKLIEEKK